MDSTVQTAADVVEKFVNSRDESAEVVRRNLGEGWVRDEQNVNPDVNFYSHPNFPYYYLAVHSIYRMVYVWELRFAAPNRVVRRINY